ncbi:MAG: hypothetical protein HQ494_08635 [Rhodospirillales bacterium]|nr:hypothetical protein [Rhodospirillales bacterium]
MRRRRPQPLLFLAFVVIMGALIFANKLPVSEPVLGLKVATERLKVYYGETPPPTNWAVAEITPRSGEVWVDLTLPEKQATAFTHQPRRRILDALTSQCPPKTDPAGSVLLKTQDIEVRGLNGEGKALAAVSCRVGAIRKTGTN